MARTFVRNVLLAAVLAIAAAGAANFAIDPFQQYRIPARYEPRFYNTFQRYVNPGLARNYAFDRLVIGSSMTENISGRETDAAFGGGRTMNLSLSAMTAYDARILLDFALAQGRVNHVLYNMDFNAFSGSPRRTGLPEPLPLYLYDDWRWNDYPYLLSAATLRKSLEISAGRRINRFSTDADRPWYWAGSAVFSARVVARNLDPADLNRGFRQPPRTVEAMMASFEANVLPVLRAHRRARFDLVYPPYSILAWADFTQRAQLDATLEFKRRVWHSVRAMPNVRVHDFQARTDIIDNLDLYSDIYHFAPSVSTYTVAAVARDAERVTDADLEQRLARQRELALRADPAALIARIRRQTP